MPGFFVVRPASDKRLAKHAGRLLQGSGTPPRLPVNSWRLRPIPFSVSSSIDMRTWLTVRIASRSRAVTSARTAARKIRNLPELVIIGIPCEKRFLGALGE